MVRPLIHSFVVVLLVACGGGDSDSDGDAGDETTDGSGGGMVQVDPPNITWQSGVTDTVDTGAGGDGTCGPAELCARSIEECDVQLDQDTCEAWYDSDDCRDMDAYIACNCDCIGQAECDGYFACGELCYEDHCL